MQSCNKPSFSSAQSGFWLQDSHYRQWLEGLGPDEGSEFLTKKVLDGMSRNDLFAVVACLGMCHAAFNSLYVRSSQGNIPGRLDA